MSYTISIYKRKSAKTLPQVNDIVAEPKEPEWNEFLLNIPLKKNNPIGVLQVDSVEQPIEQMDSVVESVAFPSLSLSPPLSGWFLRAHVVQDFVRKSNNSLIINRGLSFLYRKK